MQPLVNWRQLDNGDWVLLVGRGKKTREVARVYSSGVWFTWGHDGAGGENSIRYDIEEAKKEAAGCAIRQGFI